MGNSSLSRARYEKNDEFYTQLVDVEREMFAYVGFDKDVFRGKTVLLPCDGPEWSNFTRFFVTNFEKLGLRELISTCYAPNNKLSTVPYQPTLFETEPQAFNSELNPARGKIFTLNRGGNGTVNIDNLPWEYLEGDGDFRSPEVTALRDEADIIITNPPFSLFREYLAWVTAGNVLFAAMGTINAVTYKGTFPLIQDNKMWLGACNGAMNFRILTENPEEETHQKLGNVAWFTNIPHGKRNEPLRTMTMEDQKRFSKHKIVREQGYIKYDNYDAIEVPYVDAIPSDYAGVMGVPISFLDKYNPEQFKIVGITKQWFNAGALRTKLYPKHEKTSPVSGESSCFILNAGPAMKITEIPNSTYYKVGDEMFVQLYARVLIQKENNW
jgi:hypothetical protein